jgi:hypothetical protein
MNTTIVGPDPLKVRSLFGLYREPSLKRQHIFMREVPLQARAQAEGTDALQAGPTHNA